jgi:hypothetical protein
MEESDMSKIEGDAVWDAMRSWSKWGRRSEGSVRAQPAETAPERCQWVLVTGAGSSFFAVLGGKGTADSSCSGVFSCSSTGAVE